MSKANQFLKEEDAVSPVIGVILMVAITVILAAVIAAFVFGMGPPEQAPQASIRASAADIGDNATIKLEHQGGDQISFTSSRTTVSISGNTTTEGAATYDVTGDTANFDAGDDALHLDTSNLTEGDGGAVAVSGETINVKIIDVTSQQLISDMDVRF
jgi:flagellin-like protein